MQSVASATEELTSSVNEISRQVQESARGLHRGHQCQPQTVPLDLKILGAALQANGETRSVVTASSIRTRSVAWTILLDWTYRSRRSASVLWTPPTGSCACALELGLELCPAEVGPVAYKDQPLSGWLIIAMNVITVSVGGLSVFRVEHDDRGLWLSAGYGHPESFCGSDKHFVFVRPVSSSLKV